MYLLLSLFFISLFAIVAMIGRKMVVINASGVKKTHEEMLGIPLFEDFRTSAAKNVKKYGYIGLVITMRTYFKSTSLLKKTISEAKTKVRTISEKSKILNSVKENKEASKFLEMVSDYKHKLRKIKKEIQEEERDL